MTRALGLGLVLLSVVGCAAETEVEVGDPSFATETAVLVFHDDWRIEQLGRLVAGGAVRIDYDEARLPTCRGDFNGQPGWTITGYHALNGGEVASLHVAGFSATSTPPEPLFALPHPGELEIWFENTSRWGCSAYDSNFGANYRFTVGAAAGGSEPNPDARAVAHFLADGTMQVEGRLARGGELRIDYAPERLEECRGDQYGMPGWTITGYASFGDAAPSSFYVAGFSATGEVEPPVIELESSGDLALWFQNTSRWGCSAYDSADGANYHLAVE